MRFFTRFMGKEPPPTLDFFAQLPPEISCKIFSELALQAPVLEIIPWEEVTAKQKARVVERKIYHLVINHDARGNTCYQLGFSKKSSDGNLTYVIAPLDQGSVFYTLWMEEPDRVKRMQDPQAPRDTYAFYFLEQAIEAEKGIVFRFQDRIRLASLCQGTRAMMNSSTMTLSTMFYAMDFKKTISEEQLEITLRYVLFGDPVRTKKQLKANPSLLLLKNTHPVTDFSGKGMSNLTPFQAALCVGDVEMCEMMKEIFKTHINDGETLMWEQFNAIFPNGIDAKIQEQQETAFNFIEIFEAIRDATVPEVMAALHKQDDESPLCHALKKFRADFEKLSHSEEIFNPYHLLEAFQRLDQNEFQSIEQRNLFALQVIGFIQRYLPACYAQAFTQSVYDLVQTKKPLQRSFKFKYSLDACPSLHVPDQTSHVGLGFDYWMYQYGNMIKNVPTEWGLGECLQNFIEQKYRILQTITPSTSGYSSAWI